VIGVTDTKLEAITGDLLHGADGHACTWSVDNAPTDLSALLSVTYRFHGHSEPPAVGCARERRLTTT
jgi:hypothetical protein